MSRSSTGTGERRRDALLLPLSERERRLRDMGYDGPGARWTGTVAAAAVAAPAERRRRVVRWCGIVKWERRCGGGGCDAICGLETVARAVRMMS
jgi:hypothetical protein